MATRAILTHQPEVECDVCGRRLLRGERPDAFLDAGNRRIVCELCIPRAVGYGWARESEALAAASAETARGRPGRSLIERLRQRRQGQAQEAEARGPEADAETASAQQRSRGGQPFDLEDDHEHPYTGAYAGAKDDDAPAEREPGVADVVLDAGSVREVEYEAAAPDSAADAAAHDPGNAGGAPAAAEVAPQAAAQALALFNASEAASRIAGIARSLGEPAVTVRALTPDDGERVCIVVAWELCWYRYEVELDSEPPQLTLVSEGMELEELPVEDRLGNARADERGELSFL